MIIRLPAYERPIALTLLLFLFLASTSAMQPVRAASNRVTHRFHPNLQAFDVDTFDYHIAFDFLDNTTALLIRARFTMMYLYQHHQPTISQHYFSVLMGFYYGTTVLGRPIIQSAECDSLAFYPFWLDGMGIVHDLLFERSVISMTGTLINGRMIGGMILADPHVLTRYVVMMGGTLVISGLTIHLADGTAITLANKSISIFLLKRFNDHSPTAARFSGPNLTCRSDEHTLTVTVPSNSPIMIIVDSVVSAVLVGITAFALAVMALHRWGKIHLSVRKLGGMANRSDRVR